MKTDVWSSILVVIVIQILLFNQLSWKFFNVLLRHFFYLFIFLKLNLSLLFKNTHIQSCGYTTTWFEMSEYEKLCLLSILDSKFQEHNNCFFLYIRYQKLLYYFWHRQILPQLLSVERLIDKNIRCFYCRIKVLKNLLMYDIV